MARAAVFAIERTVEVRGSRSKEVSYYISSLDAEPEKLMKIAREHWTNESMHWLLDVTFSEDQCRYLDENAHKTLNSLRKYALVVHKKFIAAKRKKSSIKANTLACLLNHDLLLSLFHFS